jgi:hypothetical protein
MFNILPEGAVPSPSVPPHYSQKGLRPFKTQGAGRGPRQVASPDISREGGLSGRKALL